jgi:hypothetical protein
MQSGQLIVTGKDEATIPLSGIPCEVKVHFKHELEVTPCNPHHRDCLEYEVHVNHHHNHHNKFKLVIKWEVSGVREITWKVSY